MVRQEKHTAPRPACRREQRASNQHQIQSCSSADRAGANCRSQPSIVSISTMHREIENGDPLHPLSNAAIPTPSTRTSTNRCSAWALAREQPAHRVHHLLDGQKHGSLCDYCHLISRRSCNGPDSNAWCEFHAARTRRNGRSWVTFSNGPRTLRNLASHAHQAWRMETEFV